jgi:hypothetical protein
VRELGLGDKDGIEAGRGGADGGDDAGAGGDGAAVGEADGVHIDSSEADALGAGENWNADIAERRAAFGAAEDLALKIRAVTLNGDVEVVFEREGDHIADGEIKVAATDQLLEAGRVGQLGGADDAALDVKRTQDWLDVSLAGGVFDGDFGDFGGVGQRVEGKKG